MDRVGGEQDRRDERERQEERHSSAAGDAGTRREPRCDDQDEKAVHDVEKRIDEVEAPRLQPEDVVLGHVDDVHQRPVVVRPRVVA